MSARPGFYRQELNKTVWEVPERYQNLTPVGSGAYGSVCSAYDVVLRQKVAVKKLSRPFQSLIHSRRSYRELRLLKHMKHENVIGLLDVFTPAAALEDFNELYLVTNLMGADLNNIVKFQRLSDEHVQFLIYQLLRGLKDLKPSNVAVNEDCELRILDFGLARQTDDEMTGYVATRWYRAPEIMLNWMHYNQNDIDQLKRIMEMVGTPTPDLLKKICSEHAQKYIQSLPFMPQQDLEKIFRGANPLAVDLLKRMLVLDCDGRISASEALSHPYFSQYHDPDDEPEAPPYDQTLESKDRTLEEWKELVFEEVNSFKAPASKTDSLQVEQTGFYRQEVNRTAWEVPERYRDLKQVGTGAYGTVCSAWDRRSGTQVAIKKLHRPFQSKLFAKRAYRELRLLKHMKHENVIGLLDVFTAEISLDRLRDFYLVMPFMGTDLGKLMKLERLSEDRVQFLVYQMLKGLKYIHSAGIIHRDLKPGNLAINPDCELKILDFGLARQADSEMTGYVVTRWYRAPEVILNWMHYTQTVDIWSAGCIMAEMLLGKPLFKGNDHLDQLREIMKITGTPAADFVIKLQSQDARNYIRSLPKVPKKDLHTIFSKASSNAVCVLEKMLLLDPEQRVSASEALDLPFFSEFRDTEEETEAQPYDQTMDNTDLPLDQWKRHTFTEILTFRPSRDSRETSL
eukprot:superscaffoldBa00001797_g12057